MAKKSYHTPIWVCITPIHIFRKSKKSQLTQFMCRKGNCWGNAPMESFFGHFKVQADYKDCGIFIKLQQVINSYIEKYNHRRYQVGLK